MAHSTSFDWRRVRWRWVVVTALVVLALTLGLTGFTLYFRETGEQKTAWDIVYLTLQLFTLESGAVAPGRVNGALQLARFLAPIAAAYAIVAAVLGRFSDRVRRELVRFRGGHVIVCGLGRKGERLIEKLREAGRMVVVIEADEHNQNLRRCRELGCVVILGRADDAWNLRRAHVDRAELIIAVAGADGVNIETAVRGHAESQRRKDHVRCIVHVADPDLQSLFMKHDVFGDRTDPFDLEFFNSYEVGARIMLAQSRVFDPFDLSPEKPPHLLIVGLGELGEALFRRAVKDWCLEMGAAAKPLRVTLVDVAAAGLQARLRRRFPEWCERCALECVEMDIRAMRDGMPGGLEGLGDIDAAFVCLDDDANAVYGGLALRPLLPAETPIVVRVSEEAGLASVLSGNVDGNGVIEGVNAVGLMDIVCSLELLLNNRREVLAQAIHQAYVHGELRHGRIPADNPAMKVWHHLLEEFKRSNREQADQLRGRLEAIGCRIVPNPRLGAAEFEFRAEEVEQLARMEHERWLEERRRAGWRCGETRDLEAKTNPYLVEWDELPDEQRDWNRSSGREIPAVLAKADLEIRRER